MNRFATYVIGLFIGIASVATPGPWHWIPALVGVAGIIYLVWTTE